MRDELGAGLDVCDLGLAATGFVVLSGEGFEVVGDVSGEFGRGICSSIANFVSSSTGTEVGDSGKGTVGAVNSKGSGINEETSTGEETRDSGREVVSAISVAGSAGVDSTMAGEGAGNFDGHTASSMSGTSSGILAGKTTGEEIADSGRDVVNALIGIGPTTLDVDDGSKGRTLAAWAGVSVAVAVARAAFLFSRRRADRASLQGDLFLTKVGPAEA